MSKRSRKRKGTPTIRDEAEGVQRSAASEQLYEIAKRQLYRSAYGGVANGTFMGRDDYLGAMYGRQHAAYTWTFGDFVDDEPDPHAGAIDVEFTVKPIQEPEPPPTLLLKERNLPGTDVTE